MPRASQFSGSNPLKRSANPANRKLTMTGAIAKRMTNGSRTIVSKWGTDSKGKSRDAVIRAWKAPDEASKRKRKRKALEAYQRERATKLAQVRTYRYILDDAPKPSAEWRMAAQLGKERGLSRSEIQRTAEAIRTSTLAVNRKGLIDRDALFEKIAKYERSAQRKMERMALGTYKEPKRSPLAQFNYRTADIRNTRLNPLVGGDKSKWSTTDLANYVHKLREFNAAKTSYFEGRDGGIISRSRVMAAHRKTKAYNKRVNDYKETVADVPVPWLGEHMNAGEWNDMQRNSPSSMEESSYFDLRERKMPSPKRWKTDKDVDRWAEALDYEGTEEAAQDRIEAMYEQIGSMLARIGDPELTARIASIDDDTLWFLWTNDATFANSLSHKYEAALAQQEGDHSSISWAHMQASQSANNHLKEIFDALQDLKVPSGTAGLGG